MISSVRRLFRSGRRRQVSPDFRRRHAHLAPVIEEVVARRLTYLSVAALEDLADVVADAEASGLPGSVVEAGTALGGSAVVLGRAKSADRPLLLFDVFGRIPPPSERDGIDVQQRYQVIADGAASGIGGEVYYGYRDDLLGDVQRNLASFGLVSDRDRIRFVPGLYQDTMPVNEPVAIAHVDCDWYESVTTCLEGIEPALVPGGRFIIDDYDAWSGCRAAVDAFLAAPRPRRYRLERRARLHIISET